MSGACTHVEYTRSVESAEAVLFDGEVGSPTGDFEGHQINTLTWLDPTGAVCAGATTGLGALNSAISARDKAIEDGKREYEYEYNVYAPVSGLYCGGYYRWGSGLTIMRGQPATDTIPAQDDVSLDLETWELGFVAKGTEQFEEFDWVTWTFGFEFAVGKYDWVDKEASRRTSAKDYDDAILFRMPLELGLGFYPPFLFGLGIEAGGGADFIAWALTAEAGEWYQKFDYDVRAAYQLKNFNPVLVGLSVGYESENLHWGEYWLKRQGPYANVSLSYVF